MYSLVQNIDEHIEKFRQALQIWDIQIALYYIKEIEGKFIYNIEKQRQNMWIPKELEDEILSIYTKRDEIKKGISLN